MTLEILRELLEHAEWFQKLGQFDGPEGMVALKNLEAWRSEELGVDEVAARIAEEMAWLPTKAGEPDPIHGLRLRETARELEKEEEFRQQGMAIYKLALTSLRAATAHPLLRVGPHNFLEAAKGAAAYAARAAAGELVVGQPGPWCALVDLYARGFWPCGILPNRQVVVL